MVYGTDKLRSDLDTSDFRILSFNKEIIIQDLKGLAEFCQEKHTERGYVVTKSLDDFGLLPQEKKSIQILRIPATLLCYWMGEMEIRQQRQPD